MTPYGASGSILGWDLMTSVTTNCGSVVMAISAPSAAASSPPVGSGSLYLGGGGLVVVVAELANGCQVVCHAFRCGLLCVSVPMFPLLLLPKVGQ